MKVSRNQPTAMEFDGKLLLREIRKRPLLYEKNNYDYSNLADRRKAWVDICETLIKGWSAWNAAEKERAIFLANKRWQNMRNCFMRELKAQKNEEGTPNPRRRKYYYYDDMLFLIGQEASDKAEKEIEDDQSEKSDDDTENIDQEDIVAKRIKYNSFDTTDLIKAIKAEPVMYDKGLETSKIKDDRKDALGRIAFKIYGDTWKKWKSSEKNEAVEHLKIRWCNLRTCFLRELKMKKLQPNTNFSNKRRREYMYYKPLKFLLPHCEVSVKESKPRVEDYLGDKDEGDDDEVDEKPMQEEFEYNDGDIGDDDDVTEDSTDYYEPSTSSKPQHIPTEVKQENVEVIVHPTVTQDPLNPQYDGSKEIDQDVSFALSLVPMMRELSATRKLEIQIEILRLFKKVSTKN